MHVTALPSPFGIGDLGPGAYAFVDFLGRTSQRVWQVLPLVPVAFGHSPYSSPSTFATNPMLISPQRLLEQGLLRDEDFHGMPDFPRDGVDFDRVLPFKEELLRRAYDRFAAGEGAVDRHAFESYCAAEARWLDDYALFMALKQTDEGAVWTQWPEALVTRQPEAIARARDEHHRQIRLHQFWQFLFATQWDALKDFCRSRGVSIFGDLPIYVAHDSADVWAHPHLFHLDEQGNPTVVAGVPPDYFSETGQRWGNPIYRWDEMAHAGYAWWAHRLAATLQQVDMVRLDHFRGFEAYWEVPAWEPTAMNGRWVQGPGASLFHALRDQLGALPVVAENLGIITPEVTALMQQFDFPGMAVLQFGFDGGPTSDHLPHNYVPPLIAYTGTHDNDTLCGWWSHPASTQDDAARSQSHAYAERYLGMNDGADRSVHWTCIRAIMASVAKLVVFPLQDVLGLGSEARMNTPGLESGNWRWRLNPDLLTDDVAHKLRSCTVDYLRA